LKERIQRENGPNTVRRSRDQEIMSIPRIGSLWRGEEDRRDKTNK
jgi:hypothetical protein